MTHAPWRSGLLYNGTVLVGCMTVNCQVQVYVHSGDEADELVAKLFTETCTKGKHGQELANVLNACVS